MVVVVMAMMVIVMAMVLIAKLCFSWSSSNIPTNAPLVLPAALGGAPDGFWILGSDTAEILAFTDCCQIQWDCLKQVGHSFFHSSSAPIIPSYLKRN